MPHEMTDEDFLKLASDQSISPPRPAAPEPILPLTNATVAAMGTSGTSLNAPPPLDQREIELGRLGKREGVPFHQGLPTLDDIRVKARTTTQEQLGYLARQYGAQNIRMNELGEPVVNIKGEDYVVDPHKLTLNSLTGLMAYSPEVLLSALAIKTGGKDAGLMKQALLGAVGGRAASLTKEAAARSESGEEVNIPQLVARHTGQAALDTAGGGGVGNRV